jgi:hypothetical protein
MIFIVIGRIVGPIGLSAGSAVTVARR